MLVLIGILNIFKICWEVFNFLCERVIVRLYLIDFLKKYGCCGSIMFFLNRLCICFEYFLFFLNSIFKNVVFL